MRSKPKQNRVIRRSVEDIDSERDELRQRYMSTQVKISKKLRVEIDLALQARNEWGQAIVQWRESIEKAERGIESCKEKKRLATRHLIDLLPFNYEIVDGNVRIVRLKNKGPSGFKEVVRVSSPASGPVVWSRDYPRKPKPKNR